jgi:hypothetical protein
MVYVALRKDDKNIVDVGGTDSSRRISIGQLQLVSSTFSLSGLCNKMHECNHNYNYNFRKWPGWHYSAPDCVSSFRLEANQMREDTGPQGVPSEMIIMICR